MRVVVAPQVGRVLDWRLLIWLAVTAGGLAIGVVVLRRSIRGPGIALGDELLIGASFLAVLAVVLAITWLKFSMRLKSILADDSGRHLRLRGTYWSVWHLLNEGVSDGYQPLTFFGTDLRAAGSEVVVLLDAKPASFVFLSGWGPSPVGTLHPPDDSTLTLYLEGSKIRSAELSMNGESVSFFGRGNYELGGIGADGDHVFGFD